MKHCFAILLLAACLAAHPAKANFNLTVGDPREGWWTNQQGTIEEATLTVHPRGLYLEYGLFLTFSAADASFQPDDSLEIVLDFELPENAIVHDSWLWIGDEIAKAAILDRWTASGIFEEIVERRQDPSILFKETATQYQLRIFPMRGDETRKVKITYLMPVNWQTDQVRAALPVALLTTSTVIPPLELIVFDDFGWSAPSIANLPGLQFTELVDTLQGPFYRLVLQPDNFASSFFELGFDNPMAATGYYARKLDEGDGGYYQLAFLPSHFLPPPPARKVAVVIDAEPQTFNFSLSQLLETARDRLKANLSAQDSFNVIYQKTSLLWPVARASETWLPASPATIDAVFDTLVSLVTYSSDVAPLLGNALEFINAQAPGGRVLLLSSSDNYANVAASNVLILNILQAASPLPVFHIVDFRTSSANWFYANGQYYYGSEYLLQNLAQLSGGTYETIRPNLAFHTVLDRSLQNLVPLVSGFDFHTTLENGFCFNRFFLEGESFVHPYNQPILQVGRFFGDMPLEIEFVGVVEGQVVGVDISIPASEILSTDSLLNEMWHGNYIRQLENEPATTATISNIIDVSIESRVLSLYTAFLCLEDTVQYCDECEEEPVVSTETVAEAGLQVQASPNPFTDDCTFTGRLDPEHFADEVVIEIYTAAGRLVVRLVAAVGADGSWTIDWPGTNVAPGVYFAAVRSGKAVRTVKLIKQ
jgi:hypothetical protein